MREICSVLLYNIQSPRSWHINQRAAGSAYTCDLVVDRLIGGVYRHGYAGTITRMLQGRPLPSFITRFPQNNKQRHYSSSVAISGREPAVRNPWLGILMRMNHQLKGVGLSIQTEGINNIYI